MPKLNEVQQARRDKQVLRAEQHRTTDQPLFGVLVLFDVWRNENTRERKLVETHRSAQVPYMVALNAYAETPNPASQLLVFRDQAEYEEVSAELALDIVDPQWLEILFNQI